ncbi:hypothetical protein G4B88_000626 [Cannabis sativa]|uniref:DUF1985 domain-containing protein n=1 Tax=Cannabis sativa TaxID=3483 RepID=A0A7J6ES61_CANSA|nr:hypothetical protein G4B88_000626 [Cannabis sativa]
MFLRIRLIELKKILKGKSSDHFRAQNEEHPLLMSPSYNYKSIHKLHFFIIRLERIIRLNVRHLDIAMILLFGNMNRYLLEIFCEQENTDANKHNIAMVNIDSNPSSAEVKLFHSCNKRIMPLEEGKDPGAGGITSRANMTKVSPMKKARRASSSRHRGGKKNDVFQDLGPEKFSSDDSRIHVTCHWHGFNCIKEFLSDLQLQELRESCFGYLFYLDESLKPAQMIMHSLLLHQECNSNGNELQLSFNINKVKFSIVEFGIITGLNCNEFLPDSDIIEHPNRLLNKYCSGNESISRKELAECLMKTRIDDDDDVVKLTTVFIVQNILQSKRGQCHVDNFVMKLVDDEEMFEKYPWGRRSFSDTVNSLSTVLNRRKTGYEICGFPLAFQITCVPLAPVDDNRSTTAEQIGLNHDSSNPRMNDRRTNLRKEIEDLMKESASLKALNDAIREENVEIKKENAEIREKITEITNENYGLKDEIPAVRKQVDVFMQYFTDLHKLKTSFKNIEKRVLWLAENGGAEKRTCGEKENAKESGKDLVFLNESKNTFSQRNFHECTNELKSSNTVFSGPDCHPNVAEILQDSNVKIHQMKEGQQDKEANEGCRSMDRVNDEDKEVVEANKSGKTIIESDDDIPTFNVLSQSFSENENESLCETLKVLHSKRKRKTTLSRYLISPFEPLNKPKGTRQLLLHN